MRDPSGRKLVALVLHEFSAVRGVFALLLTGLLICLMNATSVSGNELVGKVRNGTTRKFAPGDEVVLLSVSKHGIKEIERCKTDDASSFRFKQAAAGESYLVRVLHDGVAYEETVEPQTGKPPVVEVYDVAGKLDGIAAVMDVQRFEATNGTLEIKQLVTIRNSSNPPRTLLTEHSFEIQLPSQAQVKSGFVQVEDRQPVKDEPKPGEQRDRYYFRQPLRPGDTRFAVVYQLPYTGRVLIEPKLRNANERFVVMLPKSMRFEPQGADVFASMAGVSSDNVQGTVPVNPAQTLAFYISGTGTLEELRGRRLQQTANAQPKVLSSELLRLVSGKGAGLKSSDSTKTGRSQDDLTLGGLTALFAASIVCIYLMRRRTARPHGLQ